MLKITRIEDDRNRKMSELENQNLEREENHGRTDRRMRKRGRGAEGERVPRSH